MIRPMFFRLLRGPRVLALILSVLMSLGVSSACASPEKAAIFYEIALKHFEKEDYPAAVIQLKNAIQQDQRMLPAHLLLGKALLKSGELAAAEAALEEAIKQGINRGEVAIPLGNIYLALGFPQQVISKISADGLPPSLQVEVLSLRGTAYAALGNFRLSADAFGLARAADARSVTPLIAEVPVMLVQGRIDVARGLAQKAVELAPNNPHAWNMRASVAHAAQELSAALVAYDKALALEPRYTDARVARAALLIDLKREADAIKDLDFLRATALGDPRASYLRALLQGRKGDSASLRAELADAAKLIDSMPPAWLVTREQLLMIGALAHRALGNYEKAREYLEIITSRNGRNVAARKLLAAVYVDRRDFNKAQPLLESLYKAMPDDPQVQYLLGSAFAARRRYAQATELLERAASRVPSPAIDRALGFSQLGLGQLALGQTSLERAFGQDPTDFQAGNSLAMLYVRRGMPQRALKVAEDMVKASPSDPSALTFLASIKGAIGDKAGARAGYEQVLTKNPGYRPAALNLTRLDVADKRFDEGRNRLAALLAKQAADPDVLYELGSLEEKAGRFDDAVRHFTKAMEGQRRDTRPGLALLELHLGRREVESALEVAKSMAGKYPDNIPVQMALARAHLHAGEVSQARAIYQSMTRLAEFDPELQVGIGRMQLLAGNPDGAIYNSQKALQGRPDDAAALALAVEAELLRGSPSKAEANLRTLATKHPELALTAVTTGNVALARGQHAVAANAFRQALAREPTTAHALNVATALLAGGEPPKAVAFLTEWVGKNPGDVPALKGLSEAQFRAGQFAAAKLNYEKALARDPRDATMLNNYANLLLKMGDPAARSAAERLIKLAPNNASYTDTLGWILVQQGQLDSGLRYLREARLRSPGNGEIRYHLAHALARAGRKAEAREELSVALADAPRMASSAEVVALKRDLGM